MNLTLEAYRRAGFPIFRVVKQFPSGARVEELTATPFVAGKRYGDYVILEVHRCS